MFDGKVEVEFYRIGSDPEAIFSHVSEWSHQIVPAHDVIGTTRAVTLNSFIGTDGHSTTAELRPRPAHNIRQHLIDIAYGLNAMNYYITSSKKISALNAKIYAHPMVVNEPLGGHIHTSMFVKDPVLKAAQDANWVFTGSMVAYNPAEGTLLPETGNSVGETLDAYSKRALAKCTAVPAVHWKVMGWLLLPLERWLQPWSARIFRNSKYGGLDSDGVRFMYSPRPHMPRFDDWAYLHYEYRIPSTWLTHPWLAYCYLAIAKLSMMNYKTVAEIVLDPSLGFETFPPDVRSAPANPFYEALLVKRLDELRKRAPRVSADLAELDRALSYCGRNRTSWFSPFEAVQIEAWRELL